MTVEKVQGISRLEQLCEEFSEEERVRELKQEKKRQKRKNRRKNNCVCDIPTPLQTADEKEVSQEKVVFFNIDLTIYGFFPRLQHFHCAFSEHGFLWLVCWLFFLL